MGGSYQQEVDLQNLFKDVAGEFVQTAMAPGQVKHLIDSHRVELNGEVCRDPARRVKEGDAINVRAQPAKPQPGIQLKPDTTGTQ